MRSLPDDNLSYPVLVKIGTGSGSGFYFRTDSKLFLVTAAHVIYRVEGRSQVLRGSELHLISYDKDLKITTPIKLGVDLSKAVIRKDRKKDVVVIELGKVPGTNPGPVEFSNGVSWLNGSGGNGIVVVPPQSLKKLEDVLVSNDVFVLGYPSSLGDAGDSQIERSKPLLRKGIVAGKNMKNETIILDCPVYFGNSGGLAIEVEQIDLNRRSYKIIGVISQYVPFIEKLRSEQLGYINTNVENSGYSIVVPIDTIIELTKDDPEPSKA